MERQSWAEVSVDERGQSAGKECELGAQVSARKDISGALSREEGSKVASKRAWSARALANEVARVVVGGPRFGDGHWVAR